MTLAEHQNYKKALVENVVEFYILNQFWAALLPDLRRVINLQGMHTLLFAWPLSSFDPRMRPGVPQRFKPYNRRKKTKMWRPSLKIGRGVSRQTRIEASRTSHKMARIIDLRLPTGTTINNSGDQIRAITPTGIR